MKQFKVGVIGLGARGSWWTKDMLSEHEQIVVTAICDLYEDRLESVCKALEEKGKPIALCTKDYRELIESDEVDTVFVLSGEGTVEDAECSNTKPTYILKNIREVYNRIKN